jgi:SAM-dependent methyltransferase
MRAALLDILACPSCHGVLRVDSADKDAAEIRSGELRCDACARSWPIVRGIPRFVDPSNYAASFGLQWNTFKREQLDRYNSSDLSRQRLLKETGWSPEWMKGRWILDAGCGAGRFLDVAATTGAQVVGVDLSNAVDAAADSLQGAENVHLVQASIYELPFRPGAFDAVYCIGVIQHTPDPARAVAALPAQLKKGGRLALTIYERRRFTKLYSKYLLRSVTRGLDERQLLRGVQWAMPFLFPVTEVLFRLPRLGRYFNFVIPVANYTDEKSLTWKQRYQWALLDTYDMLAPRYDEPQTFEKVRDTLIAAGVEDVQRLANPGLNLVARR